MKIECVSVAVVFNNTKFIWEQWLGYGNVILSLRICWPGPPHGIMLMDRIYTYFKSFEVFLDALSFFRGSKLESSVVCLKFVCGQVWGFFFFLLFFFFLQGLFLYVVFLCFVSRSFKAVLFCFLLWLRLPFFSFLFWIFFCDLSQNCWRYTYRVSSHPNLINDTISRMDLL